MPHLSRARSYPLHPAPAGERDIRSQSDGLEQGARQMADILTAVARMFDEQGWPYQLNQDTLLSTFQGQSGPLPLICRAWRDHDVLLEVPGLATVLPQEE